MSVDVGRLSGKIKAMHRVVNRLHRKIEAARENSNSSIPVQILGAGDLLGWSWMFPPYVWQFTARTIEPTTALFFYAAILREYCERDHSLGYELLKRISAVMVTRLQAAHDQMLQLYSKPRVA